MSLLIFVTSSFSMPSIAKILHFKVILCSILLSCINLKAQQSAVEVVEYNLGFSTITEALDFLEQQNITSNITVQLNARNYLNEPDYLSTQNINMNGYHLTITGLSKDAKSRILMNGSTPHVIDSHLSNFTLRYLILQGADPSNTNGSIIRQKGMESNITVDHVDFIGGYCGIRATTHINGLYLSNISSSQVPHGTFRLGNGSFSGSRKDTMLWERDSADYDMWNVEISNITLHDDQNNTEIPGSSERYNGFLLLKKIYNLKIDGIRSETGNGGGILSIENSRNVVVKNVRVPEFGFNQPSSSGLYIFKCDHIEVYNNLVKTRAGDPHSHVSYYFNVADQVSFCHNTGIATRVNDRVFFGFQLSHVNHFEANLIRMKEYACIVEFRSFNNYLATMADDWKTVNFNSLSSSRDYLPIFNLENLDDRDYIIMHNGQASHANQIDFSNYQNDHGRDQNSYIAHPENAIDFHPFSFYLLDSSQGRNIVTQSSIQQDINGRLRNMPSDAGAFDADNFFDIGEVENKVSLANLIQIYPNPVKDHFTLEFEESNIEEIDLKIYDSSGKSIGYSSVQHSPAGSTYKMDVNLPQQTKPGSYILSLRLKGKLVNKSFIVK